MFVFVSGTNLSTCVFQLVQTSQNLLGTYRPRCTADGEFEPIQCHGSECWCVDHLGELISGTETQKPDMPTCEGKLKMGGVV